MNVVSVIIPVYNVAPYIAACIQSVINQTYRDIEIIFVDDCGTDNSINLIKDFIANHCEDWDIKIVHHDHNRGLSAARNTGLKTATGDYVYFLDSDDCISSNCIELLLNEASKNNCDFVIGDYSDTLGENASPLLLESGCLRDKDILHSYAKGLWYVMAWNKLCKRVFLLKNDLYFEEGINHEDVIWTFKLACSAKTMGIVHEQTYLYSIRAASIMTGMSIEKDIKTYLAAFGRIKDYIIQKGRTLGKDEYTIFEGKKNGIMYSLMEKDELKLFWRYYPYLAKLIYISPLCAYKKKVISLSYCLRDLHYSLPSVLGRIYKILFYLVFYRMRGKKIEGLIWK